MQHFITVKPITRLNKIDDTDNSFFVFDEGTVSPSSEVYFCTYHRNIDQLSPYEEIGSSLFFEYLKLSTYEHIVFFIHGFNTTPEDAFKLTDKLQKQADLDTPNGVLFVPIIWPCGTKLGIIRDYFDDQKSADMCGVAISRAINKFMDWQLTEGNCHKRMHILAHSMGNRVLKESLEYLIHYDLDGKMPCLFETIFMKAADIVNTSLEYGHRGHVITQATKKVIVYHASDDRALAGSKLINMSKKIFLTKRLGHSGPANIENLPPNVYVIDCDAINTVCDMPLGHTYFLDKKDSASLVLQHILMTITKRVKLKTKILDIYTALGILRRLMTFFK